MNESQLTRVVVAFCGSILFGTGLAAQCGEWASEPMDPGGWPGVPDVFSCSTWDPDGAGPLGELVAVGGSFSRAGTVNAAGIAAYDPVARDWQSLAQDMAGDVFATLGLPNGDLLIGGDFFALDGVFASSVARWNGTSWSPLGNGLDNRVSALARMPNGDIIAGGFFQTSAGTPMPRVARWNGSSWSPMGAGFDGTVNALAVAPNGDLFAAGSFAQSGTTSTQRVARWDGSAWQPLGSGVDGTIERAVVLPNGDLVVGGVFGIAGGTPVSSIACWDGSNWHDMQGGVGAFVHDGFERVSALSVLPSGTLVAGGQFDSAGGVNAARVASWDGSQWSPLGSGLDGSFAHAARASAALASGELFVTGNFEEAGGVRVHGAAIWDGSAWYRTNDGMDGGAHNARQLRDGSTVLMGTFRTIGGLQTDCIARWDGSSWSAFGSGLGGVGPYASVRDVVEMPNGDLIALASVQMQVGGSFLQDHPLWRWDGASWTRYLDGPGGVAGTVSAIACLPDGRLLVGGSFTAPLSPAGTANNLAIWDGAEWHDVGGGTDGSVYGVQLQSDGSLFVRGNFSTPGDDLALWDGSSWTAFAGATAPPGDVLFGGNDEVFATDYPGLLYRWTGSSWSDITPPPAISNIIDWVRVLPNGDAVVGTRLSLGWPQPDAYNVMRWDGSAWTSLVPAFRTYQPDGGLATLTRDGLLMGGDLVDADGRRGRLSRYRSLCPATAVPFASGCAGAYGQPSYQPTAMPWLGGTYRAHGSNLPPTTLVAQVLGLGSAISVPLPAFLSPASPSCTLSVPPETLAFAVASNWVDTQLPIPNDAALLGVQVRDQLVAIELDPLGGFVESTVSPALELTIGTF